MAYTMSKSAAADPAKLEAALTTAMTQAFDTIRAEFGEDVAAAAFGKLLSKLGDKAVDTLAKAVHSRQRDSYLEKAARTNDPDLRAGYYQLAHRVR